MVAPVVGVAARQGYLVLRGAVQQWAVACQMACSNLCSVPAPDRRPGDASQPPGVGGTSSQNATIATNATVTTS